MDICAIIRLVGSLACSTIRGNRSKIKPQALDFLGEFSLSAASISFLGRVRLL